MRCDDADAGTSTHGNWATPELNCLEHLPLRLAAACPPVTACNPTPQPTSTTPLSPFLCCYQRQSRPRCRCHRCCLSFPQTRNKYIYHTQWNNILSHLYWLVRPPRPNYLSLLDLQRILQRFSDFAFYRPIFPCLREAGQDTHFADGITIRIFRQSGRVATTHYCLCLAAE